MGNLCKSFDLSGGLYTMRKRARSVTRKQSGKLTMPLLALLIICFFSLSAQAKYGGGTGEPNNPYRIYDANQMNAIGADANDWDKCFKLMADVDLGQFTGTEFNIIGTDLDHPFTGIFDGNGHTISNFSFTPTGRDYIGVFGHVSDPNAEIKNLALVDPNINTRSWGGSLVGYLERGMLTGCSVDGGSISGGSTGGLVGQNSGTISDCNVSANVYGDMIVGGLAGSNWGGTISNCHSNGTVSGISQVGGGLVGANGGTIINCHSSATVSGLLAIGGLVGGNGGTITNCYTNGGVWGHSILGGLVGLNRAGQITDSYAASDVSGQNNIGGLVGSNDGGGSITNCYAAGHVSGDDCVGGLVAANAATIAGSFWDIDTSGINKMCGRQGTEGSGCNDTNGKTTSEMQTQSTFTDAGWDFTTPIWKMNCEGMSYPKLSWWQPVLGDFVCPDGVDMRDFAILGAQWQQSQGEPSADIAPDGGDGIVDQFDLAVLLDNWLAGL